MHFSILTSQHLAGCQNKALSGDQYIWHKACYAIGAVTPILGTRDTVRTEMAKNTSKPATTEAKPAKARKPVPAKVKPEGTTGQRGNPAKGGVYVVGSKLPGKKVKPQKVYKKLNPDTTFASRSEDGSASISWNGHTLVSILRWMGTKQANVAEASQWMSNAGYPGISPNTLNCQITSGRAYDSDTAKEKGFNGGFRGNKAAFNKEEAAYWLSIRPVEMDDSDDETEE